MQTNWYRRKRHQRRIASGKYVIVRECWVFRETDTVKKASRRTRSCPQCGAKISTKRMPNGGWVHFETGKGLTKIKHPCLHIGEGLSRRRDDQTIDLFPQNPSEG